MFFDGPSHCIPELFRGEWLGQAIKGALFFQFEHRLFGCKPRHYDDRQVRIQGADLGKGVRPAHPGHQLIQQNTVDRLAGISELLKPLVSGLSADGEPPSRDESAHACSAHMAVIVDHKYSNHGKKENATDSTDFTDSESMKSLESVAFWPFRST
jgi:hypothetical protein